MLQTGRYPLPDRATWRQSRWSGRILRPTSDCPAAFPLRALGRNRDRFLPLASDHIERRRCRLALFRIAVGCCLNVGMPVEGDHLRSSGRDARIYARRISSLGVRGTAKSKASSSPQSACMETSKGSRERQCWRSRVYRFWPWKGHRMMNDSCPTDALSTCYGAQESPRRVASL